MCDKINFLTFKIEFLLTVKVVYPDAHLIPGITVLCDELLDRLVDFVESLEAIRSQDVFVGDEDHRRVPLLRREVVPQPVVVHSEETFKCLSLKCVIKIKLIQLT